MKEVEQLYIVNPVIKQYKKIYIFGTDQDAASIFMELCTRRIYVNGFIDNHNAGIFFFHKPVYAVKEIQSDAYDDIIILLMKKNLHAQNECAGYRLCSDICILNPQLIGKKAIIYGVGNRNERIYSILRDYDIDIIGFIDDERSQNDILNGMSGDVAIIIDSSNRHYEKDNIKLDNEQMLLFDISELPFELKEIWIDREMEFKLAPGIIAQMGEYCGYEKIKEIILYGNDLPLAKKYAEVYYCLDFQPVSFMSDKEISMEYGIPLIDEIIYKDDYLLLLYKEEKDLDKKLFELGVNKRNCGRTYLWCTPNLNTRNAMLDVNLGQTYVMNCDYPGICIYGKNKSDDFKIAILGGSTTDSTLDSKIRSWPEIMYDQYCNDNITIFNGGIAGYYSGQELIKLIRDMIKLQPDMVIIYDGYNDLMQGVLHRKFRFLGELVDFSGRYMPLLCGENVERKNAWRGISSGKNSVDDWLDNIEYMYVIAKSKNIKFFSFMQPMLFTKKNMDCHSKTIFQSMLFHGKNSEFMIAARQFREQAAEIERTHEYIHDLTHIFDDVDVYMDMVHVYEEGNEIIAQHIWNIIKDSI